MVHRGASTGGRAASVGERVSRPLALVAVCAMVLVALVSIGLLTVDRATGTKPTRCETFAADSLARAQSVTGSGTDVVVIGDSWAAGLGLERTVESWPSRLPGRVHVAGFSGSGFSARASGCGPAVSFAARAGAAVRGVPAGTPVVVAGGLNDWDRSGGEVRAGFERLLTALEGHPVTVVGPADAPARSAYVPRVEGLLQALCVEHGVPFVSVSDLRLDYLPDLLHLSPAGHAAFGDAVAARLG